MFMLELENSQKLHCATQDHHQVIPFLCVLTKRSSMLSSLPDFTIAVHFVLLFC